MKNTENSTELFFTWVIVFRLLLLASHSKNGIH